MKRASLTKTYGVSKLRNCSSTVCLYCSSEKPLVSTSSLWDKTMLSMVPPLTRYVMHDLCGAIQKFELPDSKPVTRASTGSSRTLPISADILNAAHPVGRLPGSEAPSSCCRANELM